MSGTDDVGSRLHCVEPVHARLVAFRSALIGRSVFPTSEVRMFLVFVSQMVGNENRTKVD